MLWLFISKKNYEHDNSDHPPHQQLPPTMGPEVFFKLGPKSLNVLTTIRRNNMPNRPCMGKPATVINCGLIPEVFASLIP